MIDQVSTFDYVKEPAEITRRSLAAVRAETDLEGVEAPLHDVVLRMVHACAMPSIAADFRASIGAAEAGQAALAKGRPIIADVEMVAEGIIRGALPAANEVICTLNAGGVRAAAEAAGTTRAAAAVDLWREHLTGAVVAIGNAPTALFRLLELLAAGAPAPALIIAMPVGFIGAADSKDALMARDHAPYLTLRGRFGGSALAAAAVNALAAAKAANLANSGGGAAG